MKCPYHDCQKDYNENWSSDRTNVTPTEESLEGDGLHIKTFECRFCGRQFHDIFQSKRVPSNTGPYSVARGELLFSFPSVKTKFAAELLPLSVKNYFNEAERCRAVGSLTGVGACLRKTVYEICDNQQAEGVDYREKIANLPVKGIYKDLLKQIKWLGDTTTKPGSDSYTLEEIDFALQILPFLIEELYSKDEKIEEVEKILSKVRSTKDKTISK